MNANQDRFGGRAEEAEVIVLRALMERHDGILETPEEKARTLLFSWVLSLRPGADVGKSAVELKCQLLTASPDNNPLLPHLCDLLDEVRAHAGRPRSRRRADA